MILHSRFSGEAGMSEVFFAGEPSRGASFAEELAALMGEYEKALAETGCSAESELLLRFHVSDPANQEQELKKRLAGRKGGFVSLVGQAPVSVTIAPEVSAKEALAWTSSNEQIASITQAGVVKAVNPGVVTVTIRSDAYIDGREGAMDLTKVVVLDPTKDWQQWDGRWYFCNGTAVDSFAVGWTQIGGLWYYFDAYGRMAAGWQLIDKTWYYFNARGMMQTGWQKIDGAWYFFGTDGGMRTDWQKIGKKWYYFGQNGIMRTGWIMPAGDTHWFYLNEPEGYMELNWQLIGGVWYYFNPKTGAMATGFTPIGDQTYFFNANGIYQLGWQYLQNNWYFFGPDGVMRTGWQQIAGVWYYFLDDGRMVANDWVKIGKNWFFFDGSGAMVTGTRVILGVTYVFDANGVWIK